MIRCAGCEVAGKKEGVVIGMECYNCGAKLGHGDVCGNCGENVKLYKKILHASNAYYNDALRKVGVRDLSGAIENLRASLRLNKLNRDARNLLGLIYFEMGEVVSALTEWVISKNYHPNDNIASGYLDEIQSNPKRLEIIRDKRFLDKNPDGTLKLNAYGLPTGNEYGNRLIIPYYRFG
ncbi:MAG: hypothetical protein PUB98_02620, partial [Clostridiales bacterium]|nr:hypothetical protein [Clostridiales bacterium]